MKKNSLLLILSFAFLIQNINSQIYVNPLTFGRPISTNYLGDKLSTPWYFQFEIGQATWNASEVGIGQNSDGSTGWNWASAEWYANGSGSNKQVRRDIGNFQFISTGTWYVVGRAKANSGDAYTFADESGWTNNTTLTASTSSGSCSYFTVTALSDPSSQTATVASNTQNNLSWTKWNSKNVMIVRRLTWAGVSDTPAQGTSYIVGSTLGTGTVVYNSGGTSFNDTGLTPGTGYTYIFYSENYSYYSAGSSATATTTAVSVASDYFRSKATGNWNTAASWESSNNGSSNWITATLVPGGSATGITILTSHNITLDTDVTISGLTINSGGTFTASDATSRTLTINNSTAGDNSTLTNNGIWANGSGASTVVFTGAPSGASNAIHSVFGTIAFQNITVNKTTGTKDVGAKFATGSTISGTLEIGSGGYISTAPPASFYGANAILKFNQGSGAIYNVESSDNSWSTSVIPNYITISSGTVNLNANRTATGNLLIDGGALVLKNANSTNLTIQGNWTRSSGTFTSNDGTVTLSGTSNGTVDITGGGAMTNLVIAKTGTSKVILNSSLTTTTTTVNAGSKLDINNGITLTATNLNLRSTSVDGTATVVNNGTITATTTVVEQFISSTTTGSSGRNWYISSPLSAATSSTITTATGNDLVYYDGTTPWANAGTTMDVMKGYIAKSPAGDRTIQFTGGSLNTGDKSVTDLPAGFNLVGNPYASYVDFAQATKTNVTNSIWYRSKSTEAYRFHTYNVTGGTGVNDGTAIIPPMQSFWIKTTSATNTFGFTNTMRSHQDQSIATNRLKAPAGSTQKLLRVEVASGEDKDETVVYFNDGALNSFDDYDSQKMFNETAGAPEVYTFSDNKNLVINGFNNIQLGAEIPLGFRTGNTDASHNFKLKATQLLNFGTETELVLIDKNGSTTETILNEGSEYSFNATTVNTTDRFSLVFRTKGSTTGGCCIGNFENKIRIQKNESNQIVVNCDNAVMKNATIAIYNAAGQKLIQQSVQSSTTVVSSSFKPGVYLVKLQTEGKIYNVKVTL